MEIRLFLQLEILFIEIISFDFFVAKEKVDFCCVAMEMFFETLLSS
jgi:hypothetical protein